MKAIKIITLLCLFSLFSTNIYAQDLKKSDIELTIGECSLSGRIVLRRIKNNYNGEVRIILTNDYGVYGPYSSTMVFQASEERSFDSFICNRIQAQVSNSNKNKLIDIYYKPKPKEQSVENTVQEKGQPKKQTEKTSTKIEGQPKKQTEKTSTKKEEQPKEVKTDPIKKKRKLGIEDIVPDFNNYLETIPFYSSSAIEEETRNCETHITNLKNWKDKDTYKKENHLNSYINECRDSITFYSQKQDSILTGYMGKFKKKTIVDKEKCMDSLRAILAYRTVQREAMVNNLSDVMNETPKQEESIWENIQWKTIGTGAGLLLFILMLVIWFKKANKKTEKTSLPVRAASKTDAPNAIVVRKALTTVLRKQSLEDVVDDDAYLRIDCKDFCDNSAVRTIYIKNTCIKSIYNMYAEDLRNPNNPKEDGCMVLGRWIHDAENKEYDVSLEQIVLPGDDAVFSEYELNFGGKIKLKMTEQLRRLRKETNLQYDLTCWVHSHPGLGVFFSNSDTNVQMQLKHPIHPNFLTAIVVDILTPQQEMGIFTFKRDSTISSKADMKKMYSLEELYKWAIESERSSFKAEDYYNTLANAKTHMAGYTGIELSNGAIIDMGMMAAEQSSGFVGLVHGYNCQQDTNVESVAMKVSKDEVVPGHELVGCFIIAPHCSIPSIRKLMTNYMDKVKFVLVFTPSDGLLTSIPVVNQDICMDENCYGEQNLEDLKIWTRRKR